MKKLNLTNEGKITEILDEVQKRAQTRTLNYADITDLIEEIENRLKNLKVPKKDWQGMKYHVNPHNSTFPASYNGTPEGTIFTLIRGSSNWFISDIARSYCNRGENQRINFVNESEYQKHFKF